MTGIPATASCFLVAVIAMELFLVAIIWGGRS
jgi:hypothetical protein